MKLHNTYCLLLQDGPEYFNPEGGLITMDLVGVQELLNSSIPPDYQAGGAPTSLDSYHNHLHMVHVQLQQAGLPLWHLLASSASASASAAWVAGGCAPDCWEGFGNAWLCCKHS